MSRSFFFSLRPVPFSLLSLSRKCSSSSLLDDLSSQLSSLSHISSNLEVVSLFLGELKDGLSSLIGGISSQSDDQGNVQLNLFGSLLDSFGDGLAAQDSSEDIDEDTLDIRVLREDLESNFTLVDRGTTTDIKEVGGFFSVELNSIHGSHGKSSTIDEAPNVSIESNVGKSVLGGLFFVWVNVFRSKRVLSHLEQLLLSELGIVINVQFSIDTVEDSLGIGGPWVDFDLGAIEVAEHFVEVSDLGNGIVLAVAEVEVGNNFIELRSAEALVSFEWVDLDGIWVTLGDFFDFDSSLL